MITANRLREMFAYDRETGAFTRISARGAAKAGDVAGSTHRLGYRVIHIDGKIYLAHRLAWLHVYGAWPSKEIDHINGARSDNRLANLREATAQQNHANTGIARNNKSGEKGVVWNKRANKWQSQIRVSGKLRYLGMFPLKDDAASAYRLAAESSSGGFALHLSRPSI